MINWVEWHLETLDALASTVEAADVEWATDYNGEPWVIVGDRSGSGLEYPAAFIPEFTADRDPGESIRSDELVRINAIILCLQQGDPKTQEANLREASRLMGHVENALYENRDLSGTCETLHVERATPMAVPTSSASLGGAQIELQITKTATIE